jgi:hypothetical protein
MRRLLWRQRRILARTMDPRTERRHDRPEPHPIRRPILPQYPQAPCPGLARAGHWPGCPWPGPGRRRSYNVPSVIVTLETWSKRTDVVHRHRLAVTALRDQLSEPVEVELDGNGDGNGNGNRGGTGMPECTMVLMVGTLPNVEAARRLHADRPRGPGAGDRRPGAGALGGCRPDRAPRRGVRPPDARRAEDRDRRRRRRHDRRASAVSSEPPEAAVVVVVLTPPRPRRTTPDARRPARSSPCRVGPRRTIPHCRSRRAQVGRGICQAGAYARRPHLWRDHLPRESNGGKVAIETSGAAGHITVVDHGQSRTFDLTME